MKRKVIGIVVMTLMIATAVLPAIGTMNKTKDIEISSLNSPNIEWEFITGGPYQDLFNDITETDDGGFIACGVEENPEGVFSGLTIKLDENGNEEWRVYETEVQGQDIYSFGITEVVQTHDGGYIVMGACERLSDFKSGFLWKIDANGETEWLNSGYSDDYNGKFFITVPWDILPVVNGYIVTGGAWYIGEYYQLDVDAFLMKTDLNGDVEWQQIYRYGEHHDEGHALCQTYDDGYIIVGTVNNKIYNVPSPEDSDIWFIKTDAEGNKQWEKTYGGSEDDWTISRSIFQTSDGGYITNCNTQSYNVKSPGSDWNVWLLKIDSNGNLLWNRTYGEYDRRDSSWGMDTTSDGGYVISGAKNHNEFISPQDSIWLVKTDSNGNVDWSETWGGDKTERSYSIEQTSDNGYIIGGTTASYSDGGDWDMVLIKYSAFDNNRPNKPEKPTGDNKGDTDTEYTFSCSGSDPDSDQLYYRFNWGDGELSDWLGPHSSGGACQAVHSYEVEDKFEIKVMTMDEHGGESDWSDPFTFSTPRNKIIDQYPAIIQQLLERFPILKSLLS